jgi:hypothetical protein
MIFRLGSDVSFLCVLLPMLLLCELTGTYHFHGEGARLLVGLHSAIVL